MPRREVEDWIEIDEHDEVYHIYSDVEIVNVVRGQEEPEHIEEIENIEENADQATEPEQSISINETFKMCQTLKQWFLTHGSIFSLIDHSWIRLFEILFQTCAYDRVSTV